MTSPSSQLQVQHININELKASEFNPRTWSDHQLAKLRESIEKFGVVDPLIVNTHPSRKNIVIGGNMRLQVLQELKYAECQWLSFTLPSPKSASSTSGSFFLPLSFRSVDFLALFCYI